ncbi:MAG: hypothetical protein R8M45_12100 [Ghiorsea sp.]
MQRFTTFITLIAFFLTMAMPALAVPPVCKHSVTDGNSAVSMDDCHGEHIVLPEADEDMDMSDMDMDFQAPDETHFEHHAHQAVQLLADAESICIIECGCGCNSDPDIFPQGLTPHLPSTHFHNDNITSFRQAVELTSEQANILLPPDNPPPKNI